VSDPHPSTTAGEPTILVVEDEASVRKLVEFVLVSSGYRVTCANDGIEGLTAFAKHRHSLSLVITDLQMPRLGGAELIGVIRKENRNILIVVASGYLDEASLAELKKRDVAGFLHKPFTVAQLVKTISDVSARGRDPGPMQ